MPIQGESIAPSTGIKSSAVVKLSWEQFDELTCNHLTSIAEAEDSLRLVCCCFTVKGGIRPIQCRQAIKTLNETKEKVEQLCILLNRSDLPIVVIALRHRPLVTLHHIEKQIDDLTDLINSHRIVCMKSSQSTLQQRREISAAFDSLLEHVTAISPKVKFLSDEAKFQERKIIAELEEKTTFVSNSTSITHSHEHTKHILKKRNDCL